MGDRARPGGARALWEAGTIVLMALLKSPGPRTTEVTSSFSLTLLLQIWGQRRRNAAKAASVQSALMSAPQQPGSKPDTQRLVNKCCCFQAVQRTLMLADSFIYRCHSYRHIFLQVHLQMAQPFWDSSPVCESPRCAFWPEQRIWGGQRERDTKKTTKSRVNR